MKKKAQSIRDPTIEDAMRMLAIRSFALSIGQRAIQAYVTKPHKYKTIQKVLAAAITQLNKEAGDGNKQNPPDSCIDPWVLCSDQICRLEGECS